MKKRHARELGFIIVVNGLLTFPVLAAGSITVQPAQQQSIVGAFHAQLTFATEQQGKPNARVWVNSNSGVYHCPGTRWYPNPALSRITASRTGKCQGRPSMRVGTPSAMSHWTIKRCSPFLTSARK